MQPRRLQQLLLLLRCHPGEPWGGLVRSSFAGPGTRTVRSTRRPRSPFSAETRKKSRPRFEVDEGDETIYLPFKMSRQLKLELPQWGGRRRGAGRRRKHARPGLKGTEVPHRPRPELSPRHPVHVTLGFVPGLGYLRSYSRARAVEQVLREACERFGVRVVHYTIQGMHLHLILEAENASALSRGMQGLCIRLARRLNALARRDGRVLVDRYHAHVLKSRREVANAVRYVRENFRHHAREHLPRTFVDPFASTLAQPQTWLLTIGCRDG